MKKPPIFPMLIGTGLGSGFWPWGPGTAGSAVGVLVWYALSFFMSDKLLFYTTLELILIFTLLGIWATAKLMPYWGDDPSRVVIDEVVGVWIPLLATPCGNVPLALLSLVLFRFFDILKPLGIRAIDNHKGAFYVMADDIVAGIYSLIVIIIARWAI